MLVRSSADFFCIVQIHGASAHHRADNSENLCSVSARKSKFSVSRNVRTYLLKEGSCKNDLSIV